MLGPDQALAAAMPDTAAAPPAVARPVRDRRTRALLEAPIVPTLARLAAPNVLVMLFQSAVGLVEAYFVGQLGTDALAGVSLVFPALMLMQMMSAGAMGGGISSSVARAIGAGRHEDANALALHAIIIALVFGAVFSVALLGLGRPLYALMGGSGGALAAALAYSNVVFAAAGLIWLFNSLAAVIRGTGNMLMPASVTCAGVLFLVPLSPCLIFGLGPFPRLGVVGGGVAVVIYYAAGAAVFAAYLVSGRAIVRLSLRGMALRWPLFRDILRVGLVAALVTVTTNVTIATATALVGSFGTSAIAGFGVGSRLEYLLVPLCFGLGGPLVALVGTNMGAGQGQRALRVAWVGAVVAAILCEAIGLAAAAFPYAWLTLFGADATMLDAGARYLHWVGPFYGFFGFGMALYFASQGAGRLAWPLVAGLLRLAIATLGGWLALRLTGDISAIFAALGLGLVAMCLVNALSVAGGAWFSGRVRP
jgi:putative MATE family efflux protein